MHWYDLTNMKTDGSGKEHQIPCTPCAHFTYELQTFPLQKDAHLTWKLQQTAKCKPHSLLCLQSYLSQYSGDGTALQLHHHMIAGNSERFGKTWSASKYKHAAVADWIFVQSRFPSYSRISSVSPHEMFDYCFGPGHPAAAARPHASLTP